MCSATVGLPPILTVQWTIAATLGCEGRRLLERVDARLCEPGLQSLVKRRIVK